MGASGNFLPDDLTGTEAQIAEALGREGLSPTAARSWLASAAGRLSSDGQWFLDYDADLQVASFEVWQDGELVFGLDDWLPLVSPRD